MTTETMKTLNLTSALEAYINQQADFLAQQTWNNLVNIASTAVCDFGVDPTFDDCKYNAYAIAMSPDTYVFDKEIDIKMGDQDEPNNVENEVRVMGEMRRAARSYDERKALSSRQYDMVSTWSDIVTRNIEVLKDLKAQGIEPSLTPDDLYTTAIQNRRDNMQRWRNREDENRLHRQRKMQEQVRKSANTVSIF